MRAPGAVDGKITVAFDTNVAPDAQMEIQARERIGNDRYRRARHGVLHRDQHVEPTLTGTATFNVTPAQAGVYFKKIQCFCFTQQTLKPGETQRMPVIFYVDPAILKDPDARDIQTITLSYTFYPVDSGKTPS